MVAVIAVLSSEAACLAAYALMGMQLTFGTLVGRVMLLAPAITPAIVAPAMSVPMSRAKVRLMHALEDMRQARDALIREVAARQEIQERLEHLVRNDPLTGILNRRGFFEAAGVSAATRALLLFDVDDFKLVNDRLGHLAGDRVLRAVASSLSVEAGPTAAVARLGGDEYIVLLDDLEAARALTVGPRTILVELSDTTLSVSVSTGMALLAPGENIDNAIAAADRRMYANKHRGLPAQRNNESRAPAEGPSLPIA